MRKPTHNQIVLTILWPIAIAGIALLLLGAVRLAVSLGSPIPFGWVIPHQFWDILGSCFVTAFVIWIVFADQIKSYWHAAPKLDQVWADSLVSMRAHKLLAACLVLDATFSLFG